jgi:tripartite ATP-independent transporter DctP family solute receptor
MFHRNRINRERRALKTQITIRSTVTATAVAAALQALAVVPASAQTVLKFAWQLPLTNYASKGAERVAQCIQEKSGGSIKVETYPAGQLYRARQLYEAARTGALDLAMFALGSFSTTNPMTDIVYLPFVVPSQDRMFQVLHGDLGKFADGIAGKANLRVLAYFAGSGGQFGSKGRALRKPEDFKGLKIRVPGAVAAEVVKSFGGVPTTVDAAEVYLALQRGTVDGTNFPLTSFYDRKLYETIDRLTLANVSFDPDTVVVSEKAWASLAPAGRDALKACAAEGEDWVRKEERRLSAEYVGLLRDKGMQVIELTPEERRSWANASGGIVDEFVKKHGDQAKMLVEYMRAAGP